MISCVLQKQTGSLAELRARGWVEMRAAVLASDYVLR